jgi:drug/metabolite transporter (DMT)-like permease
VAWHQIDRYRPYRQNIFELSNWSASIFGLGILFCGLQGLSICLFQWMPVSYALALFQLSGVLNVYLGYRFFRERGGWHRLLISLVMLAGAALILLG